MKLSSLKASLEISLIFARKLKCVYKVVPTMISNMTKQHFVKMLKRPRSKRNKLILCSTILLTFWFGLRILRFFVCDYDLVLISSEHNYLKGAQDPSFIKDRFLVDNGKCRIPEIKYWNDEVWSMINKEVIQRCNDNIHLPNVRNLISVNGQTLVLNEEALKPLELTLEDITCYYQVVERVEQDEKNYDMKADNTYRYSDACYPMGQKTNPHAGFLKITCYQKQFLGLFQKKIHVDFHLVAMFPPVDSRTEIGRKLAFWKERARPNDYNLTSVLIIGFDSTSRLNFHRMMPSTIKTLEDQLGAVEMNGYTKTGMNTFPNLIPLLTSHSEGEIVKLCYHSRETPLDSCPFLWKNFSTLNYINVLIEDNPNLGAFNYLKLGFLRQPTDVYVRPWMLAAYDNNEKECIGNRRTEQVEINYLRDFVEFASSEGIPFFATLWLGDRNHGKVGEVMYMDDPINEALLHMKSTGSLKNTLVIVMGDHGYRTLDIRRTLSGWFEDKLPGLWISIPENLVKTYPSWKPALHHNSRQLVTTYNIHYTLRDIIKHNQNQLEISTHEESTLADGRGGSLFEKLAERSCDEAGVPWEYCACASPIEYKGNNKAILATSYHMVDQMNNGYNYDEYGPCGRINGYNVIAMAIVPKLPPATETSSVENYSRNTSIQEAHLFQGKSHLVIGLSMVEDDYYMESFLKYNQTTLRFDEVASFRSNRIHWCYIWTRQRQHFCERNTTYLE